LTGILDRGVVPIMTRPPEATDDAATHRGWLPRSSPVSAPARALALDAIRLLRRLRDPARRPERWSQPAFRREVDLVRAQLVPLRTRPTLAASFGREAST
jgi:hypothetical protein